VLEGSIKAVHLMQVGVTAMLVASKYEEIWAPEVKDFVYISDKAYTKDQILQMEKIMLNTLIFNLTVPTPLDFLSRFTKAAGCTKDTEVRASHLSLYCVISFIFLLQELCK
jgi:cyclin B